MGRPRRVLRIASALWHCLLRPSQRSLGSKNGETLASDFLNVDSRHRCGDEMLRFFRICAGGEVANT